ncbi:hypothetical protein ACOSQ2_017439 [Xanthoceras sorbifolium]
MNTPMLSLISHSLPQLSLNSITNKPTKTPISDHSLLVHGGSDDYCIKKRTNPLYLSSSSSSSCVVHAADKDSQQFQVDPDEARQALQNLDQQLKTLSNKQISSPKIKAQDVKLTRDLTEAEMPEISESFLMNTAVVLVIFTVFYNVLFYAVIKPAVDGPDDVSELPTQATTTATESPKAAVSQPLSQTPEISVQ